MRKFESREFLNALDERTKGHAIPTCPYCGGTDLAVSSKVAKVIIDEDIDAISIGPTIPSGLIVCKKCGHLNFFAIGALGLLKEKGGDNHGEQK